MDIINVFGKILSEKTGKKLMPCSGMIRIAFREANIDSKTLKYEDYKNVFSNYLKERLERVDVENSDEIIKFMLSELVNNQAVFTMVS